MTHRPAWRWSIGALLLGLFGCSFAGADPSPAPATTTVLMVRQAERATTVIVVRHAERAADQGADPGLSVAGLARARALPDAMRALGASAVSAIYSTQFRRARDTVAPLAAEAGVEITEWPVSAANIATYARDLAREILSRHAGETVTVVGHSNTVPALVAALGGAAPPPMTEHDYGDLFQVVIPTRGPARVERSRFGP